MLNWSPAQHYDAHFVGQCLRDSERPRLERFTGQRAQLAFIGVHSGALGSAVLRVGGQPIGMLCGNPCSVPGLRMALLGLTPAAEQVWDLDRSMLEPARLLAQGDAQGMVTMTEPGDRVQARWLEALGFERVPASSAPTSTPMFYVVRAGAEPLIHWYLDSLADDFESRAARH